MKKYRTFLASRPKYRFGSLMKRGCMNTDTSVTRGVVNLHEMVAISVMKRAYMLSCGLRVIESRPCLVPSHAESDFVAWASFQLIGMTSLSLQNSPIRDILTDDVRFWP